MSTTTSFPLRPPALSKRARIAPKRFVFLSGNLPSPFPIPPGGRVRLPDKNTNLFGAMRAIFERAGGRSGNEVVLLFSDGKDSVDRDLAKQRPVKDSKQVIKEAQGSRTQIYAACFKPDGENSLSPFPIGRRAGYG